MRKFLGMAVVAGSLILGSLGLANAQSALFNIPNMPCSAALIVAQGVERNQFIQWYNGYLTALYSQGKGDVAYTLYFNPQIFTEICAIDPSLQTWRLMEQAIAQVEAGTGAGE